MLLLVALCSQAQQPPKPAAPPKSEPAVTAPEYIGSEVCQACHEDIFTRFVKSPHQAVETSKKFARAGQACESCHGPASNHAESTSAADIRNPAKLSVGQADQGCLTCHLNQPTHAGRIQSGHAKGQVSCSGCHTIHGSAAELTTTKPAQINAQCSTCHLSSWAQFQRPHAHRVAQGAMSCVDCHNPHGTFRPQMARAFAANEPGCLRCHTDKRGPFVFEHAPVRLEGCNGCHEPHGSANPRMLSRHEVRFVCLECHANVGVIPASSAGRVLGGVPPSFHDLRSPRFRNCTICHQKVHGSHVDRNYLR
ncbi:MAG: DmsE family decaheme c-type cytochrome [Bryobacteraceae bacterium]|nr:DmsE family decaheme c-type cytochrome [Bryobacteraceae bacterium]